MYVQRPESAICLNQHSVEPNRTTRPMSSLPTKPRPMSATEYRKKLVAQYGAKGSAGLPETGPDGKPFKIPIPEPDPEWTKEQAMFRVSQSAELQTVREAFARKGQRMPMSTIEGGLILPKERTFEECMSSMQSASYMLKKDPNASKKKKKKKKKK
eukprot:TRINITY_DN24271_c0_g1_i3.p1 TRINITY_DN24271_c0_g1~~TRINITY_DN24271_c0_g1_i3.p1  ORF type:complete len:156 (+),score=30.90 TRINITY_DN24271_c0_g1_i3:189-656(+)